MNDLVIKEESGISEIAAEEIKKYITPDATDKELWQFIAIAQAFGLNPIKKEIHFVKYGNNTNIVIGYEVYLKRAMRSGLIEYWNVEVLKPSENVMSWIGVFTAKRKDWEKEFVWEVPMNEVNKKQSTWNIMPEFMLKKTCIGQGMRLLIPEILGGMPYTPEEIISETSENITSQEPKPALKKLPENAPPPPTPEQIKKAKKKAETLIKIDSIQNLDELEAFVKKNGKKIIESEFKSELEAQINESRFKLTAWELAKSSGAHLDDCKLFLKEAQLQEAFFAALRNKEQDAIDQFHKEIKTIKDRLIIEKAKQENDDQDEFEFGQDVTPATQEQIAEILRLGKNKGYSDESIASAIMTICGKNIDSLTIIDANLVIAQFAP